MGSELQAISFICATLLAILFTLPRVRGNVANLAIVLWLFMCNLIHGINSVIWAGNVDLHVPVWCDIVTRVLLGAMVALPGACVCISGRMELLSSKRRIPGDPKSQRMRLLVEFTFCYLIPLLYIVLHLITQDHRFDLVQGFGCQASIYPSTPALLIMFLPRLLLCALSFALAGRAIHNSCLQSTTAFSVYIESRAPVTSSIFIRRVCLSLFITAVLLIMSLFNLFATNGFKPWISFADAHKDMWVISILLNSDDAASVRATWWVIPVVSIAYLLFMVAVGEEVREGVRSARERLKKTSKPAVSPFKDNLLPLHLVKGQKTKKTKHQSNIVREAVPRPPALNLKSGWDDMLDEGKPRSPKPWSLSGRRTPTSGISMTPFTFSTGSRTPSPLPRISTDDAFIISTIDYATSPTAKSLGIAPSHSTLSPPPVYLSPLQTNVDLDPFQTTSLPHYASPSRTQANTNPFKSANKVPTSPRTSSNYSISSATPSLSPFFRQPEDISPASGGVPKINTASVVSSVLDEYWPQPPITPMTPLRTTSPLSLQASNRVRSVSPASTIDTSASTLRPAYEDAASRDSLKPFQGPGISAPLVNPPPREYSPA